MSLIPRNFYLDDIFDDFHPIAPRMDAMKCDVYEKDGNYNIEMDIPGYKKEDISIEATNNSVTIKACFENILKNIECDEEDPAAVIVSGIKVGEADRTVNLAADIVKEEITAKHNNGTLFVTIPKRIIPKTKIDIE